MKETLQNPALDASSHHSLDNDDASIDFIPVVFEENDPSNPHNWKQSKKFMIIVASTVICLNSALGSAITSNLIPFLQQTFNVPDGPQTILPGSVYLLGFVFGPLIFAPLSEAYGRKPVLLVGLVGFFLFTMSSALAPNWASFLVFRFLAGTFGAPPVSVLGGVIADVFDDSRVRGLAMMTWSSAVFLGPLTAPIISGFLGPVGWRWAFWATTIFAAVSSGFLAWLPETFAFKILRVRANKLNKEHGCQKYMSPYDVGRGSVARILLTSLVRPVHLLCTELLLSLFCTYLAFIYTVFYMLLVIFTRMLQDVYHFSPGLSGVCFTTIALGVFIACLIQVWYDNSIAPGLTQRHPAKKPEYLRLPLACAGGPTYVAAMLWLGWSARTTVPWVVPLLAMIPYGIANQLIYMSMINYIADSYGVYSASALAASGATRSLAGALIPLGVNNMLKTLGIAWSCTVLACIAVVLSIVPFCFIKWGEKIRGGSRFRAQVQQQQQQGDEGLTRTVSLV